MIIFGFYIFRCGILESESMASFEDEAEPQPVANYYFEDENDEPISVHVLAIEWSKDKRQKGEKEQISLRGTADNGLRKIHCPVIAWKFDLSLKPVISVQLSKENKWIVLQRPRKSFEKIIRPVLVTLSCLSYVIQNPESSAGTMWQYIADTFRYLAKSLVSFSATLLDFDF